MRDYTAFINNNLCCNYFFLIFVIAIIALSLYGNIRHILSIEMYIIFLLNHFFRKIGLSSPVTVNPLYRIDRSFLSFVCININMLSISLFSLRVFMYYPFQLMLLFKVFKWCVFIYLMKFLVGDSVAQVHEVRM